jgi:alkyl hydroperoxide reductase subunit AhpF
MDDPLGCRKDAATIGQHGNTGIIASLDVAKLSEDFSFGL